MIYKISPRPSLLKRGREKAEMTHSITQRALNQLTPFYGSKCSVINGDGWRNFMTRLVRERDELS